MCCRAVSWELGTLSGDGAADKLLAFHARDIGCERRSHFQKIGLNAIDAAATDFCMSRWRLVGVQVGRRTC